MEQCSSASSISRADRPNFDRSPADDSQRPEPRDASLAPATFSTGMGSPVTIESSTALRPVITTLRRIEVDGVAVKDYAAEVGITSNNAAVRVFRAREALKKQVVRSCGTCAEHGCLDCTCAAGRCGGAAS